MWNISIYIRQQAAMDSMKIIQITEAHRLLVVPGDEGSHRCLLLTMQEGSGTYQTLVKAQQAYLSLLKKRHFNLLSEDGSERSRKENV